MGEGSKSKGFFAKECEREGDKDAKLKALNKSRKHLF
jgi:hypothetical protein